MNRRGFIRSIVATAAIATGLARTKLELVDDVVGRIDRACFTWWRTCSPVPNEIDVDTGRALEAAFKACTTGGGKPDIVWVSDQFLEEYRNG